MFREAAELAFYNYGLLRTAALFTISLLTCIIK